MGSEQKSCYGTARLYFELLIIAGIVTIAFGLITFGHAWLVSGSRIGMWIGAGLVFLGLAEIAASQVSIAILDMADDIRLMRQSGREMLDRPAKPLPRSQRAEPTMSKP